jgi:hypothetical protein
MRYRIKKETKPTLPTYGKYKAVAVHNQTIESHQLYEEAASRGMSISGGGDHGVGSTDHFSALKIWMIENKFVSLPSHLKTIEPMEVHRELRTMCNTETSKSDQ